MFFIFWVINIGSKNSEQWLSMSCTAWFHVNNVCFWNVYPMEVSGWYKVEPCQVRCLLPHEILHSLATMSCTSVFNSTMLGNQGEAVRCQFWEHVRQLKPWSSHPVLHGPDYDPRKLVGFCIHGDGCQMFKDDEVFVWSISSIFAQEGLIGDVLAFKYPFMAIPEKFMRSPTAPWFTIHPFLCIYIQSMCIYIHIYICVYTSISIHIYIYKHRDTIHMYIYRDTIHLSIYTNICIYICIYIYIFIFAFNT